MANFNQPNKLERLWRLSKTNDNSITNILRINSQVSKELGLTDRTLPINRRIIDLSSDWVKVLPVRAGTVETPTGTPNYFINFKIEFERIDIKKLSFLSSNFVFETGQDVTINLNSDVQFTELWQEVDSVTSDIKRMIFHKSLSLQRFADVDFSVKMEAMFYNPVEFV